MTIRTLCALALGLAVSACAFVPERIPERHVGIRNAPSVDLPPAFQP